MPRGDTWEEVEGTIKKAAIQLGSYAVSIPNIIEFILDVVQPYRRSPGLDGNQPLWLLGKFDNWNKHNLLIFSTKATYIGNLYIASVLGNLNNVMISESAITPAGMIYRCRLPEGDRLILQRKPDVTLGISVGTGKPGQEGSIIPLMASMLQQTAQAVQLFQTTFAKHPLRKFID